MGDRVGTGDGTEVWRAALRALAIPPRILDAAPESPWGFSVETFDRRAEEALSRERPTPSTRHAAAALPDGGKVLDVGCGAGAASLPLAARAGELIGVDQTVPMLAAFAERAASSGVAHRTVAGAWPDVADQTPVADVVVCHHVFYNVPDLEPFASRLTDHSRHRVVVELTAEHPLDWMIPFWRALHGWERPPGPTVEAAISVLTAMDLEVAAERWSRPYRLAGEDPAAAVAFLRRRLCVGPGRDHEVQLLLDRHPVPREHEVVTLWWDRPRRVSAS